jgi:hypothetical protein
MRHLLTTCVIAVLLLVPGGTLAAEEASPAATFGPDETATIEAMQTSASSLWAVGDYAGARELQEQVAEARLRVLGPEHPGTLTAMDNLDELLAAMEQTAQQETE